MQYSCMNPGEPRDPGNDLLLYSTGTTLTVLSYIRIYLLMNIFASEYVGKIIMPYIKGKILLLRNTIITYIIIWEHID